MLVIETFECLKGRVAIGTVEFVERAKKLVGKVTKEQPERKFMHRLVPFERIVSVVEKEVGERWEDFGKRRGGLHRDLVMHLARRRSGMTLKEIGELAGGLDYKAVDKAIKRYDERMKKDRAMKKEAERCFAHLAIIET